MWQHFSVTRSRDGLLPKTRNSSVCFVFSLQLCTTIQGIVSLKSNSNSKTVFPTLMITVSHPNLTWAEHLTFPRHEPVLPALQATPKMAGLNHFMQIERYWAVKVVSFFPPKTHHYFYLFFFPLWINHSLSEDQIIINIGGNVSHGPVYASNMFELFQC